jgi:hypothetical protein
MHIFFKDLDKPPEGSDLGHYFYILPAICIRVDSRTFSIYLTWFSYCLALIWIR